MTRAIAIFDFFSESYKSKVSLVLSSKLSSYNKKRLRKSIMIGKKKINKMNNI